MQKISGMELVAKLPDEAGEVLRIGFHESYGLIVAAENGCYIITEDKRVVDISNLASLVDWHVKEQA